MKYLYLYSACLPKHPKTGELQGMKKPNLEFYSYILATATISALTIWAVWKPVWAYLHQL